MPYTRLFVPKAGILAIESLEEFRYLRLLALQLNNDAFCIVVNEASEVQLHGQPIDRRTKSHSLHLPRYQYFFSCDQNLRSQFAYKD